MDWKFCDSLGNLSNMKDSLPYDEPTKTGWPKLMAIVLSLPSWVLLAGFIVYGTKEGYLGPNSAFFAVLCCLCMVFSWISMAMFLILIPFQSIKFSHVFWAVWGALSSLCATFFIWLLWYSATFGNTYDD